jgi:hypothetical protein
MRTDPTNFADDLEYPGNHDQTAVRTFSTMCPAASQRSRVHLTVDHRSQLRQAMFHHRLTPATDRCDRMAT